MRSCSSLPCILEPVYGICHTPVPTGPYSNNHLASLHLQLYHSGVVWLEHIGEGGCCCVGTGKVTGCLIGLPHSLGLLCTRDYEWEKPGVVASFSVMTLPCCGLIMTPDSCIFKMLNPHEHERLQTVFAVDGRNQTHANGHTTANSSVGNMKPCNEQG